MKKHKISCPCNDGYSDADCRCNEIKLKSRNRVSGAINRSHIKQLALEFAQSHGMPRHRRVSSRFLDKIERNTIEFVKKCVQFNTRKGVTLL
jgi:hypothetical protein